jgi:hypothetical protein
MTQAVRDAAQELKPVLRSWTHSGPLHRGTNPAAQSVTLTCPNGHTCDYRVSDD